MISLEKTHLHKLFFKMIEQRLTYAFVIQHKAQYSFTVKQYKIVYGEACGCIVVHEVYSLWDTASGSLSCSASKYEQGLC